MKTISLPYLKQQIELLVDIGENLESIGTRTEAEMDNFSAILYTLEVIYEELRKFGVIAFEVGDEKNSWLYTGEDK